MLNAEWKLIKPSVSVLLAYKEILKTFASKLVAELTLIAPLMRNVTEANHKRENANDYVLGIHVL